MVAGKLKHKSPKGGAHIDAPLPPPIVNTDDQSPVFGFDRLRSPYTFKECHEAGRSKEFLDALWRRSQMTWRDLTLADHTALGFERLPRDKIGGPPVAGMTPDEKYLVLRFASGSGRIVGFREERIYHVVWVDAKLNLYSH